MARRRRFPIPLLSIFLLLLLVILFGFYYFYSSDSPDQNPQLMPTPTTAATHRPVISYNPPASSNMNKDESHTVIDSVNSYALKNGWHNPIIAVSTNSQNLASGTIVEKDTAGGAKWFATKINNDWITVWIGQGPPNCSAIAQYNLPKTFLDCVE